jgi:hypothetical protein
MLNINDAINAVEFFFRGTENIEIGNPLPFVESYNATNEGEQSYKIFNEFMKPDGQINKIFYGEITFSTAKIDGSNRLNCEISKHLDYSNTFASIRIFDLGSVNSSLLWTSKPVFIQQLEMGGDCIISMNGFLFGVESSKP